MPKTEIHTRPIGAESEDDLEERIFWDLVEDRDVVAMARCPVNSAEHLATGIGARVQHLVSSWMCDDFDSTNDAKPFNDRASRWAPHGKRMRNLVSRIARRIHAHHRGERRHRERTDHPPRRA